LKLVSWVPEVQDAKVTHELFFRETADCSQGAGSAPPWFWEKDHKMDTRVEVLRQGDESGNGMIIRVGLASGRVIFGLATPNAYAGEWDLGPTWNYLVSGKRPFLLDAGRRGMGEKILHMISSLDFPHGEPETVVLSHGHEDHDGGLSEVVHHYGAKVLAHPVYSRLIRIYPQWAPTPEKREYPASCWHCPMPESFSSKFCLEYHKERMSLEIQDLDGQGNFPLGEGVSVIHLPGHAPDAVALLIDKEALLVGDTVLPDITPHPSCEWMFDRTAPVLPDEFSLKPHQLYGLRAYLRSLERLRTLGHEHGGLLLLPAHRLYHKGNWNRVDLQTRIDELTEHHARRCSAISDILADGPFSPEEVAGRYFDPALLRGFGMNLAVNEIVSHAELLHMRGSVIFQEDGRLRAA
jgi:glyoxylase-like metal-dependent hydrolase (beta-lactamase superfamily II)